LINPVPSLLATADLEEYILDLFENKVHVHHPLDLVAKQFLDDQIILILLHDILTRIVQHQILYQI